MPAAAPKKKFYQQNKVLESALLTAAPDVFFLNSSANPKDCIQESNLHSTTGCCFKTPHDAQQLPCLHHWQMRPDHEDVAAFFISAATQVFTNQKQCERWAFEGNYSSLSMIERRRIRTSNTCGKGSEASGNPHDM
jgi:hypothetical protein